MTVMLDRRPPCRACVSIPYPQHSTLLLAPHDLTRQPACGPPQVFEECRNLCLGLASRGVRWGALGTREVLGVLLGMGTKLFANLMARCDNIAVAMAARGFRGPEQHTLHLGPPPAERRQGWRGVGADAAVLGSLGALVALSWALA